VHKKRYAVRLFLSYPLVIKSVLRYVSVMDSTLQEPVVSIDELQRRLGLGRMAVYRGLRRGDIPSLRIGGRYVISRAMFERFIEGAQIAKVR
jgi:excisionase family DNA binding protein